MVDSAQPRDLQKIYVGQYVVQPGDSLLKIAMMHKVRTQEMAKVNQLFDDNIFPNQVLKVPLLPGAEESQRQLKVAEEIAKNNQTATYQIDDMPDITEAEESKDANPLRIVEEIPSSKHPQSLIAASVQSDTTGKSGFRTSLDG